MKTTTLGPFASWDTHMFLGGFVVRRWGPFAPGPTPSMVGHKHYIPHLTYIPSGGFEIIRHHPDGEKDKLIVAAGNHVAMEPLVIHEFWATERNSWFHCLFAEAEATKWMEQRIIRKAIARLELAGLPAEDLRTMIIEGDEPDFVDDIVDGHYPLYATTRPQFERAG